MVRDASTNSAFPAEQDQMRVPWDMQELVASSLEPTRNTTNMSDLPTARPLWSSSQCAGPVVVLKAPEAPPVSAGAVHVAQPDLGSTGLYIHCQHIPVRTPQTWVQQ